MIGKSNRVNIIFPTLILVLTWPLLGGYFFIFARAWIWALVGCIAAVFLCPSYFVQKKIIWLVLFLFVLLLNCVTGDSYYNSFPLVFLEIGVFVLCSAIAYYLFVDNRNGATRFVIIELFVLFSIIAIFTLILDSIEPGVVRNTVEMTNRQEDYEFLYFYYRLGMTNYALPHALPIIIPPLVLGIKCDFKKKWVRPGLLAFLILMLFFIYACGAATAVFLSFFMLIIAMWTQIGSFRRNLVGLIILSLLLLPFILFDDLSIMAIDFFESLTPGEGPIYERLMDIRSSITGDAQGDLEGRMSLYRSSFGEFVESILLGSNDELGGHSAFLDRLATLGILGLLPCVVFIWLQIKQTYRLIPKTTRIFYLEGVSAGFMMLLSKNMSNWEMWLMMFVFLPSLVIIFTKHSKHYLSAIIQ